MLFWAPAAPTWWQGPGGRGTRVEAWGRRAHRELSTPGAELTARLWEHERGLYDACSGPAGAQLPSTPLWGSGLGLSLGHSVEVCSIYASFIESFVYKRLLLGLGSRSRTGLE